MTPMKHTMSAPLAMGLLLSACGPDETVSGYVDGSARYDLQAINDVPFAAQASIEFPAEGEVTGRGPCNAFSATQSAPYPWFEIGPIAATRAACPDLTAESAFFAALSTMTFAEVSGPVLLLSNGDGATLLFQAD